LEVSTDAVARLRYTGIPCTGKTEKEREESEKERRVKRETRDKERKTEKEREREREIGTVSRAFRPVSAAGRAAIGRARVRCGGDSVQLGTAAWSSWSDYALTSVRYGASRGACSGTRVFNVEGKRVHAEGRVSRGVAAKVEGAHG